MCYNVSILTLNKLKYAKRIGASPEDIDRLEKEYERLKETNGPGYYLSAFSFPKMPIHKNSNPDHVVAAELSLIPRYVTNKNQADKERRRYRTANVKIETVREKKLYKEVIKDNWCLIMVDGFYEYHHVHKKAHPHFVHHKNGNPLLLAGLWDEWMDPETGEVITSCNILTRSAVDFMIPLHNNPKLSEPRMPLIITPGVETEILNDIDLLLERYKDLTIDLNDLKHHRVGKLTGKDSIGNQPEAQKIFNAQGELFD